jgi:hypothetical protein
VLRIVHRVIARFLLTQAELRRCAADTGAVTLIQRFGSAANLNIPLHCLVLVGVCRRTEGEPAFQAVRAPTRVELEGLLDKIIVRLMKMLTRQGHLVGEQGVSFFLFAKNSVAINEKNMTLSSRVRTFRQTPGAIDRLSGRQYSHSGRKRWFEFPICLTDKLD